LDLLETFVRHAHTNGHSSLVPQMLRPILDAANRSAAVRAQRDLFNRLALFLKAKLCAVRQYVSSLALFHGISLSLSLS
jgi:hypothetical protein